MSKRRNKDAGFYEHHVHRSTAISLSQDARRVNLQSQPLPSLHLSPEIGEQPVPNFSSASFSSDDHLTEFGTHLDHWADIAALEGLINGQELTELQADEEDDAANITVVKPIRQHKDNPIKAWIPYQDQYLDVMIWRKGRKGWGNRCATCQAESARFRCVEDECFLAGMFCQSCIVKGHRNLPLHWIEEWQNTHFRLTSLKQLGATYQLGHVPGKACRFPKKAHVDFTVVHTNGIHNVAAKFCGCQGATLTHAIQLLQASWFPATVSDPLTCTSFSCLRLFHHLNCLAKIPAYDFYKGLEIMTESRLRVKPKNCYKPFLLTMMQWRLLKMCKWQGRAHDPSGVQGTAQGELAVECPACPQPGRNLPPDWKDYPENLRFLFYMFLAVDANFRLKNKLVSNETKSPLLADGWAYFVQKSEYAEHLKKYVNETEMSSCSGFAAMFLANLKNVKGLRTSGVAGVCCARHGLWRKNGMGDLQVGERYCNVDYVFTKTIDGEAWECIVVSYDISCQWSLNFWKRLEEINPRIRVQYGEDHIIFMIPKFHIKAHQEDGHQKFSFDYQPGVGETHAETVEEGWASSNKAASQTKEMSAASRALTLDNIFGFYNWRLSQGLDRVLGKRLVRAVKELKIHDDDFVDFSTSLRHSVGEETLDRWDKMIAAWDKDKTMPCPYELPGEEKMSLKEVEVELAKEEHEALSRGINVHSSSSCVFLVLGLQIEESQRSRALKIKTTPRPTPTQTLELQRDASAILRNIQNFRKFQVLLMPTLRNYLSEQQQEDLDKPDVDHPENIRLFLPSDFRTSARNGVCIGGLGPMETRLREAEARDSLKHLRQGLRARTMTAAFKLKNVTGQVHNTRTQGVLRNIDIQVFKSKLRYRQARSALLSLRGRGEWERELRVLEDDDVRGLGERALSREEREQEDARRELGFIDEVSEGSTVQLPRMGESRRTLSWIWYNQVISASDASFEDAVRVEYAKAKARADRWEEEVLLLIEELRRSKEFSVYKSEEWLQKQGARPDADSELRDGLDAYAYQQAEYWYQYAQRVDTRWGKLREHAQRVVDRIPDLMKLTFDLEDFGEQDDALMGEDYE